MSALIRAATVVTMAAALAACSSTEKFKPAELAANPATQPVRQVWNHQIGPVGFALAPKVVGKSVLLAAGDGTVVELDAASGKEHWRVATGARLTAGVGSDGSVSAVVNTANELVAVQQGRVLWRAQLEAQTYTAPLVAGGRVFVVTANRTVQAFDGQSGRRLWVQQRPGEALVLKQSGVILAVGDTLVVGQGARLVGMNPNNGSVRWDAAVATSRGTNDVERLIDIVGPAWRTGSTVCVRAFQSQLGCVDAQRGQLVWSKRSQGFVGLSGDATRVFGVESDSKMLAWNQTDGERAWTQESLQHRGLGAPLAIGNTVLVADNAGMVHVFSAEKGQLLNRLTTDGSAIEVAPVAADGLAIVVTRNGGVYALKPGA